MNQSLIDSNTVVGVHGHTMTDMHGKPKHNSSVKALHKAVQTNKTLDGIPHHISHDVNELSISKKALDYVSSSDISDNLITVDDSYLIQQCLQQFDDIIQDLEKSCQSMDEFCLENEDDIILIKVPPNTPVSGELPTTSFNMSLSGLDLAIKEIAAYNSAILEHPEKNAHTNQMSEYPTNKFTNIQQKIMEKCQHVDDKQESGISLRVSIDDDIHTATLSMSPAHHNKQQIPFQKIIREDKIDSGMGDSLSSDIECTSSVCTPTLERGCKHVTWQHDLEEADDVFHGNSTVDHYSTPSRKIQCTPSGTRVIISSEDTNNNNQIEDDDLDDSFEDIPISPLTHHIHADKIKFKSNALKEARIRSMSVVHPRPFSVRSRRLTEHRAPIPLYDFYQKPDMKIWTSDRISASIYNNSMGMVELNLSNQKFVELPHIVTSHSDIESLNLESNWIRQMPNDMDKMTLLKHIDLSNNMMWNFPTHLDECKQLNSLNLNSNYFSTLPPSLQFIQTLKYLTARENQLTCWPKVLNKMLNITVVDLSCNPNLVFIPEHSLCHLTNLEELILAETNFQELPSDINSCVKLQVLDLSRNHLTKLPDNIQKLKRLETLKLSENEFEIFPEAVCYIESLKVLDLSSNDIEDIPESVSCMKNLLKFSLRRNRLRKYAVSGCNMRNLKELDLRGNAIRFFSSEILQLPNLAKLHVQNYKSVMHIAAKLKQRKVSIACQYEFDISARIADFVV